MKKILKRGLSLVLALIMAVGLLPVTAFAAVDSSGRPQDVANKLILAIYNGTGFPGEPAVYSPTSYKNINSKFEAKSGTFASSAKDQLDWNKIEPDLLQGKTSGNTKVWGVYDASGAKDYFLPTASIIQPANEAKIIRAIKSDVANKSDDEVLAKYEIIWYVIKLQHSTSWIFTTTEWHIDGVIKERELFSINYYGNGNTDGDAPTGITDHPSNKNYVVAGPGDMVKVINGASVKFLGWSARADGSGAELDFYQAGDVIPAEELKEKYGGKLSLYAMWDTTTQYTATVNTYLDNVLTDEDDIHGSARDLYLSTDNEHFYKLTRSGEGVYTTKITGNGKFHLFSKDGGNYNQIGTHQLTIYNQNGSLDVHHYSVTYDANGGAFATDPGKKAYNYGESVTAITDTPTKEGHRFLGWKDNNGNPVLPGETVTASIDKPITLTAQWEKSSYTVTTAADPAEGGTTTGDGTYAHGERVTVKATAQTGYNFCGWYEGETSVSEAEEYTFAVTSNRNLVARFAKNPYMVEANTTTGGTAAGTGIYEYGQTATVTATPEDGYAFRGWYEGTEKVSEAASYSFTVTADRTLTAQFSKVYTVKVITETGGSVSGGGAYEPMANATITATANGGYYFVGWYDEKDELVTAETSYSLTVKEDRTFTAKFEKKVSYKCDYVYIFGYNDSEIGATGPLLRGELAQMIYRLVKQNKGVSNGGNSFRDTAGEWFESGISYMAEVGAIDQNSANAYPYASVSSGETYKMICLGLGFTKDTSLDYSDYKAILSNSNLPANSSVTSKIQRYQFCELFNAILGRSNYCQDGCFDTNGNEVTAETYGYTDLKPSDSYYRTMMIATSTFTNGKIDLEKRIERNTYDYTN